MKITLEQFQGPMDEFGSDLIDIRKKFEAGPPTVNSVSEIMNSFGSETRLIDEVGVIAELPVQSSSTKNVALRAAIDDPIQAVTGLGMLSFMNSINKQVTGHLRVIFYSKKASFDFSQKLIQEGGLENISSLWNLRTNPNLRSGSVGIKLGSDFSTVEDFVLTVFSKNHSPKVIPATANIVTALNQLTSRKSDPLKPSKITIFSIHSLDREMRAPNSVEIKGNYSTSNQEVARQMSSLIKESVQGLTKAYDVEYEIQKTKSSAVTFDEAISLHLSQAAKEVLGSAKVVALEYSRNPSPNLTKFLEAVPGSVLEIGTGTESFSDAGITSGFKTLSWAFLKYLN